MLLNEKALALSVSVSKKAATPRPRPKCLETCLHLEGGEKRNPAHLSKTMFPVQSRKAAAATPRLPCSHKGVQIRLTGKLQAGDN